MPFKALCPHRYPGYLFASQAHCGLSDATQAILKFNVTEIQDLVVVLVIVGVVGVVGVVGDGLEARVSGDLGSTHLHNKHIHFGEDVCQRRILQQEVLVTSNHAGMQRITPRKILIQVVKARRGITFFT